MILRSISFLMGVCVISALGINSAPAQQANGGTGRKMAADAFELRGLKGLYWEGIENYRKAVPWMADHQMNWLMLCYSSFPESGRDWRKDYTPEHVQQIRDLVTESADKGITVCLSFNPGIWSNPPLSHSSDDDYQAAWRKIKMAHGVGIQWIALCLDDISKELTPEDKARYGSLQAAQIAFTNRLYKDMLWLDPEMRLIFCPSAYTTEEINNHMEYTKYVGDNLAEGIEIFWTGPTVCSPTITVADADYVTKLYHRKPFVWDNYPVNDMFNNTWRPLLAPVKGRDANLGGAISGILFNPMKQWNINKIPLVSVAEYLRAPTSYDAGKMKDRTLADFAQEERPAIELLLKYYGAVFLGEKNFPPGATAPAKAKAEETVNELKHLKELLATGTPLLQEMGKEIESTINADIAIAQKKADEG